MLTEESGEFTETITKPPTAQQVNSLGSTEDFLHIHTHTKKAPQPWPIPQQQIIVYLQ